MTDEKSAKDIDWLEDQINKYKKQFNNYKLFAEVLEQVLNKVAKKHAPLAIVQTRPKDIASFAEKCERKKGKHKCPINQFTDLCGGRIIVHTAEEVEAVSKFIEEHFLIDQENTIDVRQRLKPTEFGYRSVHYIISFKKGVFPNKDVNVEIPSVLTDDKEFPNRRAEVQVRTILEHAWADMAHELVYKGSFEVPSKWEREFAGVAAMLESADKTFSRIEEGLSNYLANYGAYMTDEQMRNKIKTLEIILANDPQNVKIADQIGAMAVCLEDWQKAIDVLSNYKNSDEPNILRNLGIAFCKISDKPGSQKYRQGQRYLEKACKPPDEDLDALVFLAETYEKTDEEKSRTLYHRAYEIDSTYPNLLERYLDFEIYHFRDASIISLMKPVIDASVQRCKDQAEVGVNLPWAYYSMGKFYLLLDKPYESVEAYAKAIQLSSAPDKIETALEALYKLRKISRDIYGYQWVERLLIVGRAVVTSKKAGEIDVEIKELKKTNKKDLEKEEKTLNKLKREKREFDRKSEKAMEEVLKLALSRKEPVQKPVVIVVGGCDPAVEEEMRKYRKLLMNAFSRYEGTVIGGGTQQGISGLVGEAGKKYRDTIWSIGYIPGHISSDATLDQRYTELRETDGIGYSPIESLQSWIDIIAGGLDPSEVKILGINGGMISAIEYRIGLALGATVGIVEDSGREAGVLMRDEKWCRTEKLIHLPADPMTLKAFIGSGGPKLKSSDREKLSRIIHDGFRESKLKTLASKDPALEEWESLPKEFKESSARQADDIYLKLREIGCTVHEVGDREIELFTFTEEEIEFMAEIEHGRWNAERLLEGWRWGEEKDVDNKKSPYLVSWEELPEDVKEWDRFMVSKIPELLKEIGQEIRRN